MSDFTGPIEERDAVVAAEAVAAVYPEGGWREHLARLEARVRRLESVRPPPIYRWRSGEDDAPGGYTTDPEELPVNAMLEVYDPESAEFVPCRRP